jgi:uncharacterized membrane protein
MSLQQMLVALVLWLAVSVSLGIAAILGLPRRLSARIVDKRRTLLYIVLVTIVMASVGFVVIAGLAETLGFHTTPKALLKILPCVVILLPSALYLALKVVLKIRDRMFRTTTKE